MVLGAAAAAEGCGQLALYERAVVGATVEGFWLEEVRVRQACVVWRLGWRWQVGGAVLRQSEGVVSLRFSEVCVDATPAPVRAWMVCIDAVVV